MQDRYSSTTTTVYAPVEINAYNIEKHSAAPASNLIVL